MKIGLRSLSLKKSLASRTYGRATRTLKSSLFPWFGKKGVGMATNPKKAIYNKVYNKTTVSYRDVAEEVASRDYAPRSTAPRYRNGYPPNNRPTPPPEPKTKKWLIIFPAILVLITLFLYIGMKNEKPEATIATNPPSSVSSSRQTTSPTTTRQQSAQVSTLASTTIAIVTPPPTEAPTVIATNPPVQVTVTEAPIIIPPTTVVQQPMQALTRVFSGSDVTVKAGQDATFVMTGVAGSEYSISVTSPKGNKLTAAGLKVNGIADANGVVSWTWNVGAGTETGNNGEIIITDLASGEQKRFAYIVYK